MVSTTNMGTALLQWHPPALTHGPLQGYRLRFGRKDVDPLTVIEFPERENHYTTKEIHKGASYTFRLSARNKVGFAVEGLYTVLGDHNITIHDHVIEADFSYKSVVQEIRDHGRGETFNCLHCAVSFHLWCARTAEAD